MDTNALKKFAQGARNLLIDQVSARLDMVLANDASARREHPKAIAKLEQAVAKDRQQVIDQAAYTWFNRFTALRFMDVTGLTNPRTVSPADGATRPEILAEALAGNLPEGARPEISEYLTGTRPAHDGQAEAYRLLLIHACNEWHDAMPFMFEKAEDYTALLMPDDLLSPDSILARLREVMSEEACQDVEIIGWLYQFYISEKKDQVFAGLKKNQKITAENIPAATQLFTPHWIVRYLVENSLGRLWLLNRPQSKLAEKMDYYIAPEEPETDFLRITKPEDIKICDPACGSGHMLTYAFDLLHAIYEEEGYEATTIPGLILQHNLTGIEIDDRAGALAAFALSMKAAAKLGRRRFAKLEAKPVIVVLQNVSFTPVEMQDVEAVVGKDMFTAELRDTLGQFAQAKNFGSLIVPNLRDPAGVLRLVVARDFESDLLLKEMQKRVLAVLRMAEALSPEYHVIVANPPYAGAKGLNPTLQDFLKSKYSDCKADLFAAFIRRGLSLVMPRSFSAMVTMESWMFLSSYEKFRLTLLEDSTISNMLHMPYLGKGGTSMGISFGTTAFVAEKRRCPDEKGNFQCVRYYETDDIGVPLRFPTLNERSGKASSVDFTSIPGGPLAYWANEKTRQAFVSKQPFREFANPRVGMQTANNDYFLRSWWEVSLSDCSFFTKSKKWVSYSKGGEYRRWWGNNEHILFFDTDGGRLKAQKNATLPDLTTYKRERCTWSDLGGNSKFGVRMAPLRSFYDIKGHSFFPSVEGTLSYSNSNVFSYFLSFVCSGMNFQVGDVGKAPSPESEAICSASKHEGQLVNLAKSDWDAYETSWGFTKFPLLSPDCRAETLEATYADLRAFWQGMTDEMQWLEEANNRIFIDAYGLVAELTAEVPIEEVTLTCNPAYSIKSAKTDEDREIALRARTVEEFLHYAVGCMFGRYSLDEPGLVLANQGGGD